MSEPSHQKCPHCRHVHLYGRRCGALVRWVEPHERSPFEVTFVDRGVLCHCTKGGRFRLWPFRFKMTDRNLLRIAHGLVVIAVVVSTMALCVPEAFAAQNAQGDGVLEQLNPCDPDAPIPQPPDSDLPGVFIEQPNVVVAPANPNVADTSRLFSTSGVSGMRPIVYDTGCGFDPRNADERIGAWTNSQIAGWFITWGQATTMFTSAVEQYAWDPAWIGRLLGDLSEATVNRAQARVVLPFLALGLIICSVLLVMRARRGNFAGVAQAVAWALLVMLVAALVVTKPTSLATGVQSGTGEVVNTLYGNAGNPTLSATETVMQDVHYQGWLRRTFGTEDSDTARRYGPALLAATRITWQEQMATDPSRARNDAEREQILDRREQMLKQKADLFEKTAEKIKAEDPEAYAWLTGTRGSWLIAGYEWTMAVAAGLFRILAGFVVILGIILLTVLGLAWLLASPWLVTPWGEPLGRALLDNTARVVGSIVVAGVGTWMYVVYLGIVMTPGTPSLQVFVLVGLGTFAFWGITRPDRKILSMLTAGRVRGRGRWSRKFLKYSVLAAVASRIVSEDAVKAAAQRNQPAAASGSTGKGAKTRTARPTPPPPPRPPRPRPSRPPRSITNPPAGSTSHVYQRPPSSKPKPKHPTPPPPGAVGTVTNINTYQRPGAKGKKRP